MWVEARAESRKIRVRIAGLGVIGIVFVGIDNIKCNCGRIRYSIFNISDSYMVRYKNNYLLMILENKISSIFIFIDFHKIIK
jgi:hypothetical protein